jgi:DNA recombination protein RmuC
LSRLSQGKGNLVRQAEMLRKLGVSPSKRLAAPLQALADPEEGSDEDADPGPEAGPDGST